MSEKGDNLPERTTGAKNDAEVAPRSSTAPPDSSTEVDGSTSSDAPPDGAASDAEESTDPALSLRRVTVAVVVTTSLVTLASYLAPEPYEATAVGLLFLAATYVLVLRHSASFVAMHGLSLGGLFEPSRLSLSRILKDAVVALAWALGAFTIVALPFAFGFRIFFHVHRPFAWHVVSGSLGALSGQLLVIALPEEAFFRGFLQTELEGFFSRRIRVFGADVSLAIVVASAIFAAGHLFTNPKPARLAVFFPSLLFGFLRTRTKGIGASVVFHSLCNLLSATLAQGYGVG